MTTPLIKFDLLIPEDRIDEFEAWFAEHGWASSGYEVASFDPMPDGRVAYSVRIRTTSSRLADLTRETWAS